jgi:hypothetical protein
VQALYEDVHWIDPSTLELLGLVIERNQRLPVLVLITFRPEFQLPWTGDAHVATLTMSRLGRRQGADVVARVTGDKPLPGGPAGRWPICARWGRRTTSRRGKYQLAARPLVTKPHSPSSIFLWRIGSRFR